MNLTSLYKVKLWLGSATSTDDSLLNNLIGEAAQMIMNYLSRANLNLTTVTETHSGRGERKLRLRNWPVISVNSLSISGVTIPASTGPTIYGYALEAVYGGPAGRAQDVGVIGGIALAPGVGLNGYNAAFTPGEGFVSGWGGGPFLRGTNNIICGYTYGYCVQNEPWTIPASNQVTPAGPNGPWSVDNGVSFANGGSLTPQPVGTSLTTGQYIPPNLNGASPQTYYQFAAADSGKGILLNYSYVPADLEQACIELVAERYTYKKRIGQKSQSLGGQETTAYDNSALTDAIKQRLFPYKLSWAG